MYLLDTNVISELRKPKPHGAVLQWVQEANEADLHLSAVTIGEIQAGIEITREQDAEKAAELERWLVLLAQSYNVLPMDAATFRIWAQLMHRKSDTLYEDAMIAATALGVGIMKEAWGYWRSMSWAAANIGGRIRSIS
jgi:predicted nucleic acid-binding protein